MLSTSYGAWLILLLLLLTSSLRKNTINVTRDHFSEYEKLLDAQIKTLEIEKKKYLRQIARYKLIQEEEEQENAD
jgi:competence protein ComGC